MIKAFVLIPFICKLMVFDIQTRLKTDTVTLKTIIKKPTTTSDAFETENQLSTIATMWLKLNKIKVLKTLIFIKTLDWFYASNQTHSLNFSTAFDCWWFLLVCFFLICHTWYERTERLQKWLQECGLKWNVQFVVVHKCFRFHVNHGSTKNLLIRINTVVNSTVYIALYRWNR